MTDFTRWSRPVPSVGIDVELVDGGTPVELMLTEDAFNDELDEEEQASLNRELALAMAERATTGDLTFDTVTDEHIRLYQESMPDSPRTRDVIRTATSDLPVLRWLGRRRIAATINARAKAVK